MSVRRWSAGVILAAMILALGACSDYGYADGYGGGDTLPLDPDLYGTWVHGEGDEETSWTFKSNGTCVQYVYYEEYDWKWGIEGGQLKLFVDGGIPAYKTYKVEGNQLYFWVDLIDDWGLPFTKE